MVDRLLGRAEVLGPDELGWEGAPFRGKNKLVVGLPELEELILADREGGC